MAAIISARVIPRAFVWRRLHSLMGLWFLIFLAEHMFTNSQAAVFFGNRSMWFVNSVTFLHNLPYLPLVEGLLLGVPMALHAGWGIWYMMTAKSNVVGHKGKAPSLKYERNKAYSLQRITAWIILVGIIFHVVQMRFVMYPFKVSMGNYTESFGRYNLDKGLYAVAEDLKVRVYDSLAITSEEENLKRMQNKIILVDKRLNQMEESNEATIKGFNPEMNEIFKNIAAYNDKKEFVNGLKHFTLEPNQVIINSKKSADLILLNVREAFQSIWMCIIYTLFVLASVFHGCNGFWTFCVTWGLLLSKKSQESYVNFAYGLAFVLLALGMFSIWGSYFFSAGYYH
jgi:succinate dehydrogenase / fumarate reductase cytochrome b subunit